ncbi:response regulator [Maridesulfovibrio hydrothermalis]|uniref:Response regulator receiver protein n=1 Tax=Maridesulfovibrio hydrothermalis AM13 = DSM 14728 TaxID=1121451 RepID=L0RCL3_9BACT|nr:response regulator [Maridesulfovibrio hydrothermalis]CCO23920.1 Response regulator receiver protein [Maridesulfovibrio hydrothermalis AM13 = DSM 14728]
MRALIAEDEFVGRKLLSTFMAPLFEIDIVVNGKEAVDAFIMAYEEDNPYAVIFMDIMMPELDGISALEAIRKYEKSNNVDNNVKVIMTTALDDAKTVIRSFHDAGASAYIVKPVIREKLYEELEKIGLLQK